MIPTPEHKRKYQTAHDRLLRPAIINFFAREFPGSFGPMVRENITDALLDLFESLCPETDRLKPGQIIWNALDVKTRASSPNRRYKPVILTIVSDEEISMFENNKPMHEIRKGVIARMIKEAYSQGGILSMRDISLMLVHDSSYLSHLRIEFEETNQTALPHTGALHDVGTTISHKRQIIYKYVVEKKDPAMVALETNHSQLAVDRYLKDYFRVKTLIDDHKDVEFINIVTKIAKPVIRQYQQIIEICQST
jgi:hypothetical protein